MRKRLTNSPKVTYRYIYISSGREAMLFKSRNETDALGIKFTDLYSFILQDQLQKVVLRRSRTKMVAEKRPKNENVAREKCRKRKGCETKRTPLKPTLLEKWKLSFIVR